ncbi:DUF4345 family protein [Sphingobacterium hungaricum]
MIPILKISGVILIIAGFIFTLKPDLVTKFPTSIDAYQMIEKRVPWGLLIGLGLFLLFYTNWTSWGLGIVAFLFALTLGIIIARLTGLLIDGFFVKQIWWLLIELAVLFLFGFLYWKQKH